MFVFHFRLFIFGRQQAQGDSSFSNFHFSKKKYLSHTFVLAFVLVSPRQDFPNLKSRIFAVVFQKGTESIVVKNVK